MKILTTEQIRQADEYTIKNEPIASIDLMERASKAFVSKFLEIRKERKPLAIFCGTGNNGGDGLAIARLLVEEGWEVKIYTIGNLDKGSPDFKTNLERIEKKHETKHINDQTDFPDIKGEIIIDAIFGSGLSRPAAGLYGALIDHLNDSDAPIFSVDIASGLFAESPPEGSIIEPDHTITFQFPKLAFMQPESAMYVGQWHVVHIGLLEAFTSKVETNHFLTEEKDIRPIVPKRSKFMHKGNAGKLLLISGSEGKMGATILSARSAFKSGVGLLVVHTPGCGRDVIQNSIPEAMVSSDKNDEVISEIIAPDSTNAVAIGPGIGTSEITQKAVLNFFKQWNGPLVVDADGLNILSENPGLMNDLPEDCILTPHPKEFERLVGTWKDDYEKLELLSNLCQKHKINVVLKGAHSAVCDKTGIVHFNSTGNQGMATAGSGDVLTGIIGGLLAQGLQAFDAVKLGVYIHGLAGDLAALEVGQISLISSDLVDKIPSAILKISKDFLMER